MADIPIDTGVPISLTQNVGPGTFVWKTNLEGYFFYVNGAADVDVIRTTDGGETWDDLLRIRDGNGTNAQEFQVWADWKTAGNSGTKIHVAIGQLNNLYYNFLDTATYETRASGPVDVTASTGLTTGTPRNPTIVRARSGRIYIANANSGVAGGAENSGFDYSDDDGESWTNAQTLKEGSAFDYLRLFPGNHADDDDVDCIFVDVSAAAMTLKKYDASLNSWSESSTIIAVVNTSTATAWPQWGATLLDSGLIFCLGWNAFDTSSADATCALIDPSDNSITSKTNPITNADDCFGVALAVNPNTGRIYFGYLGKSDGSESAGSAVKLYYKYTDDLGDNWSDEQAYSEDTADDFRSVWCDYQGQPNGRFYMAWFDDDDNDIFGGFTNSIEWTAGGETLLKIFNETERVSEQVRRTMSMTRELSEVEELIEAIEQHLLISKRLNTTVEITEQISTQRGILKLLADLVEISEQHLRPLFLTRRLNNTVEITENRLTTRNLTRLFSSIVEITESTLKLGLLKRQISTTVEITEQVLRQRGAVRILSETVQIVEQLISRKSLVHLVNETVQVVESLLRRMSVTRLISTIIEVQEQVIKRGILSRLINNTVEIVEDLKSSLSRQLSVVLDEVVQITEDLLNRLGILKLLNEQVLITEQARRTLGLSRVISSAVQITQALNRRANLSRIINETEQILSLFIRRMLLKRSLGSAVQLSEQLLRRLAIKRLTNEQVQVQESRVKVAGFILIVREVVNILENISRSGFNLLVITSEIVQIVDNEIREILPLLRRSTVLVTRSITNSSIATTFKVSLISRSYKDSKVARFIKVAFSDRKEKDANTDN